jgi:hypothetical protein
MKACLTKGRAFLGIACGKKCFAFNAVKSDKNRFLKDFFAKQIPIIITFAAK